MTLTIDPDENDNVNGAVAGEEGPEGRVSKKRKVNGVDFVLPLGFLAPLPPDEPAPLPLATELPDGPLEPAASRSLSSSVICKQFWKAGDYDGPPSTDWDSSQGFIVN